MRAMVVKRVFAVTLVMYLASGSHGSDFVALNGYASSWRTSSMGPLVDTSRRWDRPTLNGADLRFLVGFGSFFLSLCGFLFTLSLVVLVRSWTATKDSDGPLLVGARVSGGQCTGEVEVTGITFVSHVLMRHGLFHPPGWMMDSSESSIGEVTCAGRS